MRKKGGHAAGGALPPQALRRGERVDLKKGERRRKKEKKWKTEGRGREARRNVKLMRRRERKDRLQRDFGAGKRDL